MSSKNKPNAPAAPKKDKPKKVCPISREEFREHAKDSMPVNIDGMVLNAVKKEFSTDSLGWFAGGKGSVTVNGKLVELQIGVNATIIGSKELPGGSKSEE